ncbi:MAG: T9SS type A sorting domain-containing protein, partial [Bacteroidota bacterium]
TTCRDWTTDTVDLSAYTGQQVVLVLSTNIGSGERDWLYLDNFRVESSFTREKAESGLQPEDISLYPNPNNGAFTLEFQSYREQQLRLSLYDLHGRKLWGSVEQIGEGRIQKRIDERGLATGMYFLRMRIGELEFMRKVTVYF